MFKSINDTIFGCQDLTILDNYIKISTKPWCEIPMAKSVTFEPDGEKIYMVDQHGESISEIAIEPEFDRCVIDGDWECGFIYFGETRLNHIPFSDTFWKELRVLIDRMVYERNYPRDVKESAFFVDVDSEFSDLFSF